MLKDFKAFIMRGNVIDLAIGVIIGIAFGAVVKSLVDDVIMPPIGLATGGIDFSNKFVVLKDGAAAAGPYASVAAAKAAGATTLNYGMFVNNVVSFLIIALLRVSARARSEPADAPARRAGRCRRRRRARTARRTFRSRPRAVRSARRSSRRHSERALSYPARSILDSRGLHGRAGERRDLPPPALGSCATWSRRRTPRRSRCRASRCRWAGAACDTREAARVEILRDRVRELRLNVVVGESASARGGEGARSACVLDLDARLPESGRRRRRVRHRRRVRLRAVAACRRERGARGDGARPRVGDAGKVCDVAPRAIEQLHRRAMSSSSASANSARVCSIVRALSSVRSRCTVSSFTIASRSAAARRYCSRIVATYGCVAASFSAVSRAAPPRGSLGALAVPVSGRRAARGARRAWPRRPRARRAAPRNDWLSIRRVRRGPSRGDRWCAAHSSARSRARPGARASHCARSRARTPRGGGARRSPRRSVWLRREAGLGIGGIGARGLAGALGVFQRRPCLLEVNIAGGEVAARGRELDRLLIVSGAAAPEARRTDRAAFRPARRACASSTKNPGASGGHDVTERPTRSRRQRAPRS